MTEIKSKVLVGERSLFHEKDLLIVDTVFGDGESPLKECSDITLDNCMFKWKYPLWYSKNIIVKNSIWFEMARAGIWYTDNIRMSDTVIQAPKNFRRASHVFLNNVNFPNAAETFWNCTDVHIENTSAKGDYFGMNCKNIELNNFTLVGNYAFDGAQNLIIRNSTLLTKDAFWNCKNVEVYDSKISGEYIGWNSENVTFVNCTIESLQGLCYMKNLVMKNCKLLNTTLAFEYSSVDADIIGHIDSVLNPLSGKITADKIIDLKLESDKIDPKNTTIIERK